MGRWNVYGEYSSGDFMRLLIRDIRGDEKGVASTVGTLQSYPDAGSFTVQFSYIPNKAVPSQVATVKEQSNGSIELDVANRYYVPQKIAYENGAVIRYQSDGQVIRAQPTFSVLKTNNTLDVSFGLVSLYGAGSVSGTSTEVVNTQVFAFDRQDYQGFPANAVIWVNHTSRYGLSWYRFLNQTLASALVLGGTFTQTPLDISYTAKIGLIVIYKVSASYNPALRTYTMRLEIHNNPALLALSVFRLLHAQVQVGVGDTTSNVQF